MMKRVVRFIGRKGFWILWWLLMFGIGYTLGRFL